MWRSGSLVKVDDSVGWCQVVRLGLLYVTCCVGVLGEVVLVGVSCVVLVLLLMRS